MGQGKQIPNSIRAIIIARHKLGVGGKQIAKGVRIPVKTVYNIIYKYKKYGYETILPRKGRPKKITPIVTKQLLKRVDRNRFSKTRELRDFVVKKIRKNVCNRTIRRILNENELHGRIARKKPFVSEVNRVKRLEFAEQHRSWNLKWRRIIFTDETNIENDNRRRQQVWRRRGIYVAIYYINIRIYMSVYFYINILLYIDIFYIIYFTILYYIILYYIIFVMFIHYFLIKLKVKRINLNVP